MDLSSGNQVRSDQVSAIPGKQIIWSADDVNLVSISFSPDGSLFAVPNAMPPGTGAGIGSFTTLVTNIYKDGQLITAVPDTGVGWIDNNRLLAMDTTWLHDGYPKITGNTIYSAAGDTIATFSGNDLDASGYYAFPPLTFPTPDTVYEPGPNSLFSLTTGSLIWQGPVNYPFRGAIAGPYVVYQTGGQLNLYPY